jgi:hypothetical protein
MNLPASVPTQKRWGLSASTLKIIACVFMVVDHVGVFLLPHLEILRIIGRISFPIFAYFIAEGCRYTRNKLKRFLLVLGLMVLCEGVYLIYDGKLDGGIMMTFTFSILLVYQVQAIKKALARKKWWMTALWSLTFVASLVFVHGFVEHVLYVDYGFWGILIPAFTVLPDYREGEAPTCFRYVSHLPVKLAFWTLGMLLLCISRGLFANIQSWCLLAIPFMLLYNGTPGRKGFKYGFYVFYPAHLAVLYLIAALMQR